MARTADPTPSLAARLAPYRHAAAGQPFDLAAVDPAGKPFSTGAKASDKAAVDQLALDRAELKLKNMDLVDMHEAFAAQALSVGKELGWDAEKVNVNGGAIAIGHPIGASGARVLTTLIYEMQRRDAKKGLATLCIGGGMGIAMCIER